MKIAAVILAGGEGRRMGGDKPLRVLDGRTLLAHAVAQAQQWSGEIAVAARSPTQLGGTDAHWLCDECSVEGPLGGLIAALRFAHDSAAEAVLTIPADMPFLPGDLAGRLVEAIGASPAALASSGGHLHPVCALWRTAALDRVSDYAASGRRSLRGFAETVGYVAVDWPAEPRDPFFNINRPEDLVVAEAMARR